jgi:hypothetical protein
MRIAAAALALAAAAPALAVDVIVNEWNAVNDQKWLNSPDTAACTGAGGISCGTDQDNFFGRVMGNGSDWIELVVVRDHVDLRGWKIQWVAGVGVAAADAPPIGNGNDIWWGDGTTAQGEILFSNSAAWSDLRAGTIITLIQNTTAQGGLDTDLSFDPCRGDWWINVNINDAALCTPSSNIAAELAAGRRLHVSEDNFWVQIADAEGIRPRASASSPTTRTPTTRRSAPPTVGRWIPARTRDARGRRTSPRSARPSARSCASPAMRSRSTSTTEFRPPATSAAAPRRATRTFLRALRPMRSSAAPSATAAIGSSWW